MFDNLLADLAVFLPNLLVALLILIVGWLVAFFLSRLVENLLHKTSVDERVAGMLRGGQPSSLPIERWVGRIVFWLIMLFVIVAFLSRLNLGVISDPLNNLLNDFLAFLPNLLGALVLVVLAWLIATALRMIVVRLVSASGFARRVTETADMEVDARSRTSIGETIGNVVYWLVFLLFLPAILDALELQGILAPVQNMVNSILAVLPNILGAALLLVAGWLVARILRQIVTNLLAGVGVDRFAAQAAPAAAGTMRLSNLIGTIVFVLVLIPVVIAALNVLDIPAISEPAANMLNSFLNALPNIFAAILLLAIAYFVARMVGTFVAGLLAGIGFDRLFTWLGFTPQAGIVRSPEGAASYAAGEAAEGAGPDEMQPGRTTPSKVAGYLVMAAILLFAVIEAANLLGFEALATLVTAFVAQAVNILFGLLIFGLGVWLANQAYRIVRDMGSAQSDLLAVAARVAILIFAAALALRQMGIAPSIVNLAFGLLLGAVAVAAALAFGLGGREQAAEALRRWRQEARTASAPEVLRPDRDEPGAGPAVPPAPTMGTDL